MTAVTDEMTMEELGEARDIERWNHRFSHLGDRC